MHPSSRIQRGAGDSWPDDHEKSLSQGTPAKSTHHLAHWLLALPRWWFLGILCYAPWAYGSTQPWAVQILNVFLGIGLLLWALGWWADQRWPRLPLALLLPSVLLIAQAGWMTVNAGFIFHTDIGQFSTLSQILPAAPGSIDRARSADVGMGAALLLGTLLFVSHWGSDPVWRRRVVAAMCVAGLSLILFGLIQRVASAPAIFWAAADHGKTFFATYRYHSNAGAFINMIWPLTLGGLLVAVRRSQPLHVCAAWGIALAMCLVAISVTGARAAGTIALLFFVASASWILRQIRSNRLPSFSLPVAVCAAVLFCLALAAAAATAGLEVSARRWDKVGELLSLNNPRLLVDQVCLNMISDAGWFGFGPGTFARAFPYYTHHLGDSISGIWLQAHQDYLQTVIEWGYIGTLAWALCVGGALRQVIRPRTTSFSGRTTTLAVTAGVLMTLLHALVDFPLQIASLQLYFVTLLGLLWSAEHRSKPPHPAASLSAKL